MRKQMKKLNKKQSGFTLVEIAFVVIIIGVLLGGVLKGQEIIENAKQKRVYSDFQGIQAALFTFIDVKGSQPGESGNGAGLTKAEIDGAAGSGNALPTGFWAALRQANIIDGRDDDRTPPNSPYGTPTVITTNAQEVCWNMPAKVQTVLKNTRGATIYTTINNSGVATTKIDTPTATSYACFTL